MLDIIRGIAVLLVLKAHWIYFDIEKFGWLKETYISYNTIEQYFLNYNRYVHPGVLIFIVLSGFIIHYTNKTNIASSGFKWTLLFISKRLARIYPVFILALISGFIIQHFFYESLNSFELKVFFLNALMIYGLDYIQPPMVNNILVTIQSEFWIYVFYGLAFPFLTNPRRWLGLISVAFIIWILNYVINTNTSTAALSTLLYWSKNNSFAYILYWCIGAYAAELCKTNKIQNMSWFVPIALFFASVSIFPLQTAKWSYLLNELLMSIVVGLILIKVSSVNLNNLFIRTTAAFGRAGYSIYAFHMCIFMIFMSPSMKAHDSFLQTPLLVLLYALVLSFMMYFVFEKPLHVWVKNKFN